MRCQAYCSLRPLRALRFNCSKPRFENTLGRRDDANLTSRASARLRPDDDLDILPQGRQAPQVTGSPNDGTGILGYLRVVGQDRKLLQLALGHQQAIKRISVVARKGIHAQRMGHLDW